MKSTDSPATAGRSLARRAEHELIQMIVIVGYLYICFGALIFYKKAILWGQGVEYATVGLALVKAVVLGKFILIAHALKLGDRGAPRRLIFDILTKSLIFGLMLIVLEVIEEVIVGFIHGQTIREVVSAFAGGTLPQACAVALLMFLILIPYFAFREVDASLGGGKLVKLLFERRSPVQPSH